MDTYQTKFSNAILTSVFMGIVSTLICFVFYLTYKSVTNYPLSSLINVSSLIFGINIVFLIVGFLYYLFLSIGRKSEVVYSVVLAAITIVSIWAASAAHRTDDLIVNHEFHQLIGGLIGIVGFCAVAGIPILYHNKKFNESVL